MPPPADERQGLSRFRFDPQRERRTCEDFKLGYLSRFTATASAPLGLAASAQAQDFVYCTLVGLLRPIQPLIPQRLAWLDHALERSAFPAEKTAFQRTEMLKARAVYHWLAGDGLPTPATWREARESHEEALHEPGSYLPRDLRTFGLDEQMALCLLAEDFAAGVCAYERAWPGRGPALARSLARPLASSLPPRDWAYLACRSRLGGGAPGPDLVRSGRRMLKRWLDDPWLGRGQAVRAALWLMAVHSAPAQDRSAEQILFRAYDDLPDAPRPAWAVASRPPPCADA